MGQKIVWRGVTMKAAARPLSRLLLWLFDVFDFCCPTTRAMTFSVILKKPMIAPRGSPP